MKFLPFLAAALLLAACTQQPATPEIVSMGKLPTVSVRGLPGSGAIAWYQSLQEARSQRIADLEAYANAGVFPQNDVFGAMTPVFVDRRNVPCAVAHLMRKAGAPDLVEEVRQKNNLVRLWELKEGPVLAWILTSGLTHEECALIQPSYDHGRPGRPREPDYGDDSARDVAVLHIQDHLRSTVKKLRADTAQSLLVALQRLNDARKVMGQYCVLAARSAAVVACPSKEAMICRELQLKEDGSAAWESTTNQELAPGQAARVDWREGAVMSIVEMHASATVMRGSPRG
ncbi:hypothetical protein PLCT1_00065 [Planctomycetaceae bacterium]|nr:hypothetical protein PLCT1_00065 [Planctomycetaceae bacterium]